jgi:phage host-nuclease inhibitor protein Gam
MGNISTSAVADVEPHESMTLQEEMLQEETPQVPEGFCVRDAATAAWVVRKIVEARAYAARVREWADRELRRAQREERFFLYCYGHQLEQWARRELEAANGRRKSVNLPSGTVGFRSEPPRLEVTDEGALLRWCKASLPCAVATAERVLRGAVMEQVRNTGEQPDGAEVAGGGERFFVK